MGALVTLQGRLGSVHINARGSKFLKQSVQIADQKGWVGFARGPERFFHTEMELDILGLKPDPTALGELRGLGNFGETQNTVIERARLIFLSLRHGNLDVINGKDGHRLSIK